ncbi:MAG: MOSC domain-containing protein, partial [Actinomycetales bacterium]
MAHLVAACVVHQILPDPGMVGTTAIDKRPVQGPVKVGPYGLYADVQADRKFHGGLDKAVYLYGEDDAAHWSRELGRDLAPGWFGENFRVQGLDPSAARVGEVWRVGAGPDAVEIQITGPRTPCQTFARWVGGDDTRGWV